MQASLDIGRRIDFEVIKKAVFPRPFIRIGYVCLYQKVEADQLIIYIAFALSYKYNKIWS